MTKDIRLESFKFHFLQAIQVVLQAEPEARQVLLSGLGFERSGQGVRVTLPETRYKASSTSYDIVFRDLPFYQKGDTPRALAHQNRSDLIQLSDPVQTENFRVMQQCARDFLTASHIYLLADQSAIENNIEKEFHDNWANQEDLANIDVIGINEALTAPELRFIHAKLGNINGKKLLDVGCGLGEASVYFALHGAKVTATDLSSGMLDATQMLAARYGTSLETHQASADRMGFSEGTTFDLIYTGNLLHHVDVDATLVELKRYLVRGGTLVSWDPLAYNPAINIYRMMATEVRTPYEHPLKWQDLQLFERHFGKVRRNYFWLTTLIVFIIMAALQGRDPNKERYWKSVVQEADRWVWIYSPLEKLDRILLRFIPPLRLLCWNVVVFAEKK